MTIWDFLYGIFTTIVISIVLIGWIGTKYDIVGRDKKNEELRLKLEKATKSGKKAAKKKTKSK